MMIVGQMNFVIEYMPCYGGRFCLIFFFLEHINILNIHQFFGFVDVTRFALQEYMEHARKPRKCLI